MSPPWASVAAEASKPPAIGVDPGSQGLVSADFVVRSPVIETEPLFTFSLRRAQYAKAVSWRWLGLLWEAVKIQDRPFSVRIDCSGSTVKAVLASASEKKPPE